MKINGPYGFEPPGLNNRTDKSGKSGKSEHGGKTGKTSDGSLVQAAHNSFVSLALQTEEVNMQAVNEARNLLENGQLDTPEAARRTAEAIIDLGF